MGGVFSAVMARAAVTGKAEIDRIKADPNHTTMQLAQAYASEAANIVGALAGGLSTLHTVAPKALKATEGKPIEQVPPLLVDEAGKIADPERRQVAVEAANQVADIAGVPQIEVKEPPMPNVSTDKGGPKQPPLSEKDRQAAMSGPQGDTTGIAARITNIEPGEGIAPEASVQRGRELLNSGKDPQGAIDRFKETGAIKADDIALARAQEEELAKAASRAADKHGIDSPEYKQAAAVQQDWREQIKPMQTEWARAGSAMQGETELDTGSFHALREEFQKNAGRDFTPQEAQKAQQIAQGVRKSEQAVQQAQQTLFDFMASVPVKEIDTTAKDMASRVSALNKQIEKVETQIRNYEVFPKTPDEKITSPQIEALKQQLESLKERRGYIQQELQPKPEPTPKPKMGEEQKRINALDRQIDKLEKQIKDEVPFTPEKKQGLSTPAIDQRKAALNELRETREYLKHRLQPKPEKELTVWDRALSYLLGGEDDFDDIRSKVAADTGLPDCRGDKATRRTKAVEGRHE